MAAVSPWNDRKAAAILLIFSSLVLPAPDVAAQDSTEQNGMKDSVVSIRAVCPNKCACVNWGGDLMVDCSGRRMETLPELPKDVKYLYFQGNRLTRISKSLGLQKYTSLIELHLNDNHISHISRKGLPPKLEAMYLQNNRLTKIHQRMFRPRTPLLALNLNDNNITYVADGSLPRTLENLQLKNNLLDRVNKGMFSHLSKLRAVYLSQNKIRLIEEGSFPMNIAIINLGNNKLASVGYQFTALPRLRVLNLYSNQIRRLEDKSFKQLPLLRELSLLDNKLTHITEEQFSDLHHLTTLNLFSNKIERFHESALPPAGKLQRLYLQKNPLICDCKLEWLPYRLGKEKLNRRLFDLFFTDSSVPEERWPFDYPDEDDIRCAQPEQHRNLRVTDSAVDFQCLDTVPTAAIRHIVRMTSTVAAAATDILTMSAKKVTDILTSPPTREEVVVPGAMGPTGIVEDINRPTEVTVRDYNNPALKFNIQPTPSGADRHVAYGLSTLLIAVAIALVSTAGL